MIEFLLQISTAKIFEMKQKSIICILGCNKINILHISALDLVYSFVSLKERLAFIEPESTGKVKRKLKEDLNSNTYLISLSSINSQILHNLVSHLLIL